MKTVPFRLSHPAHWPRAGRACLLLSATLACAALGALLYVEERNAIRTMAANRRAQLQGELKAALTKIAALAPLRQQEGELAMRMAAAEEQLWQEGGEADGLLQAKLSRRAEECGLSMESFKPLAAAGAVRPLAGDADISVSGSYAQLLRFVELVSTPPRAVLIDAMEITRTEREGKQALLMNATVSIVRIADNKEGKP
ncbi:type 4a pilus biogenesis protein PilO [Herbaspirillum robiniae]|uniref:Pilus assembly protein PilO n=1 Tax=Herbaspirillum robiniae TaxID=2014887 RepID=A0A246WNE1_9BURK|nr:type 4a pilus biogenesis protein PilO [Herbaspirillum robiniae]OWY27884.1 hypothetical protein CEJ42_17535 [Herbaspirillum robiniae]